MYPQTTEVAIHGSEHLSSYMFARRESEHQFCRICGVSVCIKAVDPGEKVTKDWPSEKQDDLKETLKTTTINVRILQGVDVRDAKDVKIERCDMSSVPPLYTVE